MKSPQWYISAGVYSVFREMYKWLGKDAYDQWLVTLPDNLLLMYEKAYHTIKDELEESSEDNVD